MTQASVAVAAEAISEPNAPWQALLDDARKAMSEGEEVRVDPAEIRPMPDQPRKYFSEDGIARLADSMLGIGQIVPGIIRPVANAEPGIKYELLDGERRWRASTRAKILYRATLVRVDDASVPYIIAAVANFNREGHAPLEVSDSIAKMMEIGIPMEEIARILGISVFWAAQMHGLQNLDFKVREMLDPSLPKEKLLAVTAAVQISKVDRSLQHDLAVRVIEKTVSLKQLRGEAINVSRKAGVYIRERTRPPNKLWASMFALTSQLRRASIDLEVLFGEKNAAEVLKERDPDEITLIKNRLSTAADAIERIREQI